MKDLEQTGNSSYPPGMSKPPELLARLAPWIDLLAKALAAVAGALAVWHQLH